MFPFFSLDYLFDNVIIKWSSKSPKIKIDVRVGILSFQYFGDWVPFVAHIPTPSVHLTGRVKQGYDDSDTWRLLAYREEAMDRKPTPATHQPTKAEMDEVIAIDATPDEIAAGVLKGGAKRREPPSKPNERAEGA